MRTPPKLDDLHPWLRAKVEELAWMHNVAFPERALCLIWGHRSPEEQQAAFKAGRSRLDGINRFSLHNLSPSLAADLWVYTEDDGPEDMTLTEGRPDKSLGMKLQLLQKGSLKNYYYPMAKLAEDVGLEAGAFWTRLKDGPHIQVPKTDRIILAQTALRDAGWNVDVDGRLGPQTKSAISSAAKEHGVRASGSSLFPMSPALWSCLNPEEEA